MSLSEWVTLAIGGGGLVGIISAVFTRKSQKEKNDLDLLDRAYKEIERLDKKVAELEAEDDKNKVEIHELKVIIGRLKSYLAKYERTEVNGINHE